MLVPAICESVLSMLQKRRAAVHDCMRKSGHPLLQDADCVPHVYISPKPLLQDVYKSGHPLLQDMHNSGHPLLEAAHKMHVLFFISGAM